jgi:hypothetical protein
VLAPDELAGPGLLANGKPISAENSISRRTQLHAALCSLRICSCFGAHSVFEGFLQRTTPDLVNPAKETLPCVHDVRCFPAAHVRQDKHARCAKIREANLNIERDLVKRNEVLLSLQGNHPSD